MRDMKGHKIQGRQSAPRAGGTLVFSTVVGTAALDLDCMWELEAGEAASPGRITVALPDCTRATKQVTGLIDRWLEDGDAVAVWIEPDPEEPQVKLKAGLTTITLSLVPDVPVA